MNKSGSLSSVLLVEDNPDHGALTERALQEAGLIVRTAVTGEDALKDLDRADLVLVDYGLPKMSGLELLRAIRDREGPPVVVVTGMGSEQIAVEALKGGAIDYIVKTPGYLSSLPHAVERAWRAHDLVRQRAELQRLTLLVESAGQRDETLQEIAQGARTLLRADSCAVFVFGESGLELAAQVGETVLDPELIEQELDRLDPVAPSGVDDGSAEHLFVHLHDKENQAMGVLALVNATPRPYLREELDLAQTFASFAGMALTNITRLQLERNLVAHLQEMLDMRTQLVGSVSHELRTPLTAIIGFSEVLAQRWLSFSDEERLDMITRIFGNASELRTLVEGLLEYSTVERGHVQLEIEPLDLPNVIRSTVDSLQPLLQDRRVLFDGAAVSVRADATLVRRVLTNLLSNAIKYSAPESPITVRCVPGPDSCTVEVEDRGRGLTADETARVFEPFWRATWSLGPLRGVGLGLSLVREYLRLMDGEVGVCSEPGKGSTFFFTLPLVHAPSESLRAS